MNIDRIKDDYFAWLIKLMCENRYSNKISYIKLLTHLHKKPFRYSIPRDENRAEDGRDLRYKFACTYDYVEAADEYIRGPSSVLEMMIALAIRCEETMDNTRIGDRTRQWFWNMVANLGLGAMNDDKYDKRYVEDVLERFLDREYEPDGTGGLFTIRDCDCDLRDVEIWHQLCWYLDNFE